MKFGPLRAFVVALGLLAPACGGNDQGEPEPAVEAVPSQLVVTSPARAAFLHSNEQVIVRGTGATKALRINGAVATVRDDGTFEAAVVPLRGLNLVVAKDGEQTVEVPFMWGDYARPDKAVASAIAFDIGPQGFDAPAPAASLSSLSTAALKGKDLAKALVGTTKSGSAVGMDYSYSVTGATYQDAKVKLVPADGGAKVTVTVVDLVIDGTMSINNGTPKPVQITSDEAVVNGTALIALGQDGKLTSSMPDATATLNGFRFDSGNALLDIAISLVLKGEIEKQVVKTIKDEMPKALSGALDGIALPKTIDLAAVGVTEPVSVDSKFDKVLFDVGGGTLSLQALFGKTPPPGLPGATAPGSLVLGKGFDLGKNRAASIGLSLSIDALNQLLYAAWGTGSVSFKAANMTLRPQLPPVIMMDEQAALELALGEVMVQQEGATQPMAAVTIFQKLEGEAQADKLLLAPKGEPRLSVTWLNVQPGPTRDLIMVAAKEQLGKALKPVEVPIPKIALDSLDPSMAGQSLVVQTNKISVAEIAARLAAQGTMTITK